MNLTLLALAALVGARLTARGAPSARVYWLALAARLAAGLALGLVYINPWVARLDGGGDTVALSHQALRLTHWALTDPAGYVRLLLTNTDQPGSPQRAYTLFSNSYFFVRGVSVFNFFTGGSYWLNSLWLSLGAFGGSWLLARELARRVPGAWRGAYAGALAWPSMLFWMSGVSKDALLLAALGAFTAAALRLTYPPSGREGAKNRRTSWRWWVLLIGAGWLFWKIKFFIAAVVFVAMGALALTEGLRHWLRARWPALRVWPVFLLVVLALAPLSRVAHRAFRPEYLVVQVMKNQRELHVTDPAQPALRLPLQPSLGSFARWAPVAAAGVFTRPWLWEGHGRRWRLAGLENAALLALFGWAAVAWWRRGHSLDMPLLAGTLLVIVGVVAVMFGLTTPNLGSLYRYRAALVPFALFLVDWLRVGGVAVRGGAPPY